MLPFSLFSQSELERSFILNSYNKAKVQKLLSDNHSENLVQSKLINEFKKRNRIVDF